MAEGNSPDRILEELRAMIVKQRNAALEQIAMLL